MTDPEQLPELVAAPRERRPAPGHALFRYLFVPGLLVFSLEPWLVPSTSRAGATAMILSVSMLLIWMAEPRRSGPGARRGRGRAWHTGYGKKPRILAVQHSTRPRC